MAPGASVLTVTPEGAHSIAMTRVIAATPPFDAP